MKKVWLSGFVIVVFGYYAFFNHNSPPVVLSTTNKNNTASTGGTTATTAQTSGYKDGAYIGSSADAFYGTVQVKAIIHNGIIADVQFLQYPNDQEESEQVSQMAMPNLKQEAIKAQNAQVDTVSGATQTSQAFRESLAAALQQAK